MASAVWVMFALSFFNASASNAKRERARRAAVVALALTPAAYAQKHCGPGVAITEFVIGQIMP
jgi:hypothetical protein